jgi:hypothetical protein
MIYLHAYATFAKTSICWQGFLVVLMCSVEVAPRLLIHSYEKMTDAVFGWREIVKWVCSLLTPPRWFLHFKTQHMKETTFLQITKQYHNSSSNDFEAHNTYQHMLEPSAFMQACSDDVMDINKQCLIWSKTWITPSAQNCLTALKV